MRGILGINAPVGAIAQLEEIGRVLAYPKIRKALAAGTAAALVSGDDDLLALRGRFAIETRPTS